MKKLLLALIPFIFLIFIFNFYSSDSFKTTNENVNKIRSKHKKFLNNSPFKEVSSLTKIERKQAGLPPNKYLEREWELTMNPETGRPTFENLSEIKQSIAEQRESSIVAGRISGDASDNSWVERGPNNVGGRTRAIMFDPNDVTNETVFAGGVSGGLWKNTNISNASSSWVQVNVSDNLNVSSIIADPNDSMIFYLGTGESYTGGDASGNGIWKSIDGGDTWAKVFGGSTDDTIFVSATSITVNNPANISGDYICLPTTAFGSTISTTITADFILADDGSASSQEGCSASIIDMTGKIALIRRGNCPFVDKVLAAQDAGAIGVVMMNNVDDEPITMGGENLSITIPSVMISKADGDILVSELVNGITGSLNPTNGNYSGYLLPGAQHINDLVTRINGGVTEIYAAVGANYYAGAYIGGDSYGVYKSNDNGSSWSKLTLPLTSGGEEHTPNDIAVAADNKVWVSTTRDRVTGNGGGKIFASTDVNGVTFQDKYTVTDGARVQIAASSSNAGTLYILAEGSTSAQPVIMKKTVNGFLTPATNMALPNDADTGIASNDFTRGQAFYDLAIAVDPSDDNNLYVGGIDLFKSGNSGSSWTQFSHWYGGFGKQEVHADQHAIAFSTNDPNKMIFGNDGGVYYSSNGGNTTVSRNLGYNTSQFYSIGVAPTSSGGENFAGGLQDNGTQGFNNASAGVNSSIETQGGDGAATDYDQDTGNYYISNYVYNDNINKRRLNGSRIININSESATNGDFINQQDLDSNLNLLYTNYTDNSDRNNRIYRIARFDTNSGAKTILSNALLTSSPTALKVSPYTTTSTRIYLGTEIGNLILVTGANGFFQNWSEITVPFVGSISDIEFGTLENEIFVTIQNYGVKSIWYTNDGGLTWEDKEGNLPDMPVKCILQNPLNTEEVIVGTELGVWYTNNFSDNSPSWISAFNGMSNVKVTDLDMRDDFKVYAATYGRGVFTGEFTADELSVVEKEIASNTVSLYPTISSGELFIKSTVNHPETKVSVYDMNGRLTTESSMNLYSNQEFSFNLSELSTGMYFVIISSDNLNKTVKIIIN
jgi:photosystem II stability/assembly factor-like uncharacterized protein